MFHFIMIMTNPDISSDWFYLNIYQSCIVQLELEEYI